MSCLKQQKQKWFAIVSSSEKFQYFNKPDEVQYIQIFAGAILCFSFIFQIISCII